MPLEFLKRMQLFKEFHKVEVNDHLVEILVGVNGEFTQGEGAGLPLFKCAS